MVDIVIKGLRKTKPNPTWKDQEIYTIGKFKAGINLGKGGVFILQLSSLPLSKKFSEVFEAKQ